MAIVINGSGTVTGISVGGLPDDIVDSGTLGTDSVTADALEVSAITAGDLPAGSVLQVLQSGTINRTTISSTGTWTATDNQETITPSSASNKVLVICTNHVRVAGDTEQIRGGLRVKRDTTVVWNTDGSGEAVQVRNASNEHDTMITICFLDSPSTTSATTYTLEAKLTTGDNFYIYENIVGASMILQEIAG